ncbi:uncharacterized protein LOC108511366 isoform X1 [Phoenix dactylifera]|uniref:Uncharacterized protein LOC108511366 isoform X1 n=1 Tax=Phoenix dactylifera TaxID=42345 RepID=A0A8B9A3D2_PHODC|nr:uncharacterized protein LOC108511366 isoform X1 [Phoenix dactylifera]XP_038980166.1 uncharacterized protein LOC108511366 isoform X1 [Phoenix dactylifera]XP_038980167.1 uncharacterized protein LOC108511366 isoform X1 [Phoenix dactylifera]XP_038980168.1 uncharacterized protein LOC108511366 isoform X1 [Phoenix dactylifera]
MGIIKNSFSFLLGTGCGIYIAQNYDIPKIKKLAYIWVDRAKQVEETYRKPKKKDELSCPVSTVPASAATRALRAQIRIQPTAAREEEEEEEEEPGLLPFDFVVHVVVRSLDGSFRSFLLGGVLHGDAEAGGGHGGGSDGGGAVLHPEAGAGGGDGVCHRQGLSPALCYRVRAPVHLYAEECRVDHPRLLVHGICCWLYSRSACKACSSWKVHSWGVHFDRNSSDHVLARCTECVSLHSTVETALALGATPRQATLQQVKRSLTIALSPVVDNAKTVGLISLPGAMTGLIMGGASPLEAIQLQIVVMNMLMGASTVSSILSTYLCWPVFFTKAHQLEPKAFTAD